ncbi:hypothetical protein PHYBLDRAFT_158785, partial [Phycomyces blakesleeanus NRRL 1555(-)]
MMIQNNVQQQYQSSTSSQNVHKDKPEEQEHDRDLDLDQDQEQENNKEDSQNQLSDYEKLRLKRIEENNQTLLKLGLISEMSEDSDDVIHYESMMSKKPLENAPLVLVMVGHQPIEPRQIGLYRETIVQIALEAVKKLAPLGMLIIGTKDIRQKDNGKLWPMSMLVLEDIERAIDRSVLKLKEMVVTVPEGHSKDRQQKNLNTEVEEELEIVDEHLTIVHAIYLVFQRM